MSPRLQRTLGWGSLVLSVGLVLATVYVMATLPDAVPAKQRPASGGLAYFLVALGFSAVGAYLVSARDGNRIGWMSCGIGLGITVSGFAIAYPLLAQYGASGRYPGGTVVSVAGDLGFLTAAGLMLTFLPLLFPDGRLLSRRWRPVIWLAALDIALIMVGNELRRPDVGVTTFGSVLLQVASPLFLGISLASIASLILRYRRAGSIQRLQLKWFVAAALTVVLVVLVLSVVQTLHISFPLADLVTGLAYLCLPLSIAIAVLKYRLYEIDVVVNRALVYGTLAVFITAVYVGIVVGIGTLVGSGSRPNLALSIVATAIVAVAFQPVRERVQRFANRLVYGERASPYEVMAGFADRMAGTLSVDDVLPKMAEAAARGVGAQAARVRLLIPDGGDRSTVWPAGSAGGPFARILPISYRGEPIGEIAVRESPGQPITPGEVHLLADLAAQAGPVLHNVRLTAELQARLADISAQAAELRASRQRIVTAQETERRRLGGEIRAGIQRELEATSDQLDEVERLLGHDGEAAATRLEALTTETQHTLDGLRELARGIFPPLLADKGIVAALQAHARKAAIPAAIDVPDDLATTRFDPGVEAAVYFCCTEALRAVDGPASVRLESSDGALTFTIEGVAALHGRLDGLRDRVEALGGSLQEDTPGRVHGWVPARPLVTAG